MKERKYKEDWVNETRFDENTGRETRVPVYRGPLFPSVTGQERRSLLTRACLPWLFYVGMTVLYFRLFFPGSTVLYIFLPAALGLFPALYWALGAGSLLLSGRKKQEKPGEMTRLEKENGIGRILRSAAGCTICSLAALAGDLVFLLSSGRAAEEWQGTLLLLACAAAALGTARYFRGVNTEKEKRGERQA